ncbi:VWA domain-containing protein, partial [Streptomyces sp. cf386]|uniref:VWA domain-containing protein n=1 Tax=Streptomyces sp. cf386 TaxID=1761904 RepID=UPI00210E5A82
ETPAPEEPVVEEPVAETSVSEEPAAEEPVAETPVAEEPVVEEPAAETPVAEEPVAETPAPEEPVVEEPVAETPVSEEPAAEEPVAETPVAEEPVVEEPAAETSVAAEPEPEPVVEETAPEQHDEPAAADGEEAPQGPLAADDETGTGGAGGNTEPEGEAEDTPTPNLPAGLLTAYKAARTVLTQHNLTTTHAKIYLVLDRSASMRPYYKDGSAQALAEQTLALATHLDPENTKVHVTFFSTEVDGTGELTLPDHENKIDDLHAGLGRMGRTSYHAAVEDVLAHHGKEAPGTPALVVFQTDGAPDAKTPATQALTDAAKKHPNVFFSFVAFGDPENKAFDYLRKLKLANTSHFLAGESPKELTDAEIYEGILAAWRP